MYVCINIFACTYVCKSIIMSKIFNIKYDIYSSTSFLQYKKTSIERSHIHKYIYIYLTLFPNITALYISKILGDCRVPFI